MHQHDEHCGCGKHHHDCGHAHPHQHDEHCGCGHTQIAIPEGLSSVQADFLLALRTRHCLPVACFSLTKTDDAGRCAIALAPVYLSAPDDSMEHVKQIGHELSHLEDLGLITLDYDIPLQGYAYGEYKTSVLYAYFVDTVKGAAQLPNHAFDKPELELGSMALTDAGEALVDDLLSQCEG